MKKKVKSPEVITTQELTSLFSCSRELLTKLVAENVIQKIGRMKWDKDDCTRKYIKYLHELTQTGSTDEFKEERALLTKEKRQIEEMKRKQMEGELVNKKEVDDELFSFHREIRDNMMSISNRLAPMAAAETDPKKIKKLMDDEIRKILSHLADIGGGIAPAARHKGK
jgi:phage terminase Nu1 subunit (DNA packaging protein)